MAKALSLYAVNPAGTLAENAPLMLHMRLEELNHFAASVCDPANVEQLHNMRIAAKRLRYTLEVYASCFPGSEYNAIYGPVKEIQERIGDIHDCDVRVPLLREFLESHGKDRPEIRVGLENLLTREEERRVQLYQSFVKFWTQLSAAGFRRSFLSFLASAE